MGKGPKVGSLQFKKRNYKRTYTERMLANASSYETPTMMQPEMNEEEKSDKTEENQDLEDQTREVKIMDILEVHMSCGSASTNDVAQVYWDRDGVCEELFFCLGGGCLVAEEGQWIVA